MVKPGYLPCNDKCGKMVPPRSQRAGSVLCATCRAAGERDRNAIFWAHTPAPGPVPEVNRALRAEREQERLRQFSSPAWTLPWQAQGGLVQFDETTFTNEPGRAYSSCNRKKLTDEVRGQPFKTKVITMAQWTKGMRKPSKARYEAAMAKQHEAQALAIRRELFVPILADVLARGGSENQMEAYRLRAIEGLTQAEAARQMRCSEKNIEKLVKKSKSWLGVQNLSRFLPM